MRSTKWDGSLHRDSPAWLLGSDPWGTWLAHLPDSVVVTATGNYPAAPGLRLLPADRWWSVFYLAQPGTLLPELVYVDSCTPTTREADIMSFVNLDLDVRKIAGSDIEILDRDEFDLHRARYGYPDAVVSTAEAACAEVVQLMTSGQGPFGAAARPRLRIVAAQPWLRAASQPWLSATAAQTTDPPETT